MSDNRGDSLQRLLDGPPLQATAFPPNSRYHGVRTLQLPQPDGTAIVYLRRRFIPPLDTYTELEVHTVTEGERLDNIAAKHLGDPELFWRLCDANGVMRPEELTEEIGREIRITLPAGIEGGRT